VRNDIDQWIQLAASVLARTAQNASVVTPPRAVELRFRQLELIALHETVILLILVFHGGTVMQQTISIETIPDQDVLRTVSTHISQRCADIPVSQIEATAAQDRQQEYPEFDTFEQQILSLVIQLMHQVEDQMKEQVHRDGLLEMLSQPEFIPSLTRVDDANRAIERMRQTLEILTSNKTIGALILQALASDGVQVIIGGEHGIEEMREYSVVLSRYGVKGTTAGVLGVIGPTRMYYPRSISTVRYISHIMSDLLRELYGNEIRPLEIN
jgi:heat-inducible transcriptional repressor